MFESSDVVEISEEQKSSDDDWLEKNNTFEEETPIAGMIFASEEEVNMFYMNCARRVGFGTAKISSKNGDCYRDFRVSNH